MNNKLKFIESIDTGREIEFHYNSIPYFLGYSDNKTYICNDITKKVQYFNSLSEARLDDIYLNDVFESVVIDYIILSLSFSASNIL